METRPFTLKIFVADGDPDGLRVIERPKLIRKAVVFLLSLLAKAFRGELVPQDPNDEPASVLLERIQLSGAAMPQSKKTIKKVAQKKKPSR